MRPGVRVANPGPRPGIPLTRRELTETPWLALNPITLLQGLNAPPAIILWRPSFQRPVTAEGPSPINRHPTRTPHPGSMGPFDKPLAFFVPERQASENPHTNSCYQFQTSPWQAAKYCILNKEMRLSRNFYVCVNF
ncbi:hypothetical protein NDU88_007326 [Pleurodeles waltl]|uniref:Uncharacterized protein n=1 Tax=Pleurodeles waltl TaxID=8319 RepID=A0AAV7U0D0_PLEWA|nr:hypothetical protein NDU88_007326 [Pleurodeles waltl]